MLCEWGKGLLALGKICTLEAPQVGAGRMVGSLLFLGLVLSICKVLTIVPARSAQL